MQKLFRISLLSVACYFVLVEAVGLTLASFARTVWPVRVLLVGGWLGLFGVLVSTCRSEFKAMTPAISLAMSLALSFVLSTIALYISYVLAIRLYLLFGGLV